jgi:Holliday junction resolvase RusA-like endonuclease
MTKRPPTVIRFTVLGEPKTARLPGAESSEACALWAYKLAGAALGAYSGPKLRGPLEATFVFYRPRPRSHWGTGRNSGKVRPSAPTAPVTRPNLSRLALAVEEALRVLWADEAQIVDERLVKRWGSPERLEVVVSEVEA